MEVRVTAPAGTVDASFLDGLIQAFHIAHHRSFGYDYAGSQKIEIVNFAVSGFGMIERPSLPKLSPATGTPAPKGERPVWFADGFVPTPIYDRPSLGAGAELRGPAVVEEFGSTTVVFPGQTLKVDDHGIMIISAVA
jgi:N-methylhydantoinase A